MGSPHLTNNRHVLIVIPDWGVVWNAYCIEYASKLSNLGIEVTILDLSNLNPLIIKRVIWHFILKLSQKNSLTAIKRKVFKAKHVKYISISSRDVLKADFEKETERYAIFLNAMASKYSSTTGRRDTQLSEINSEVVELERQFFITTLLLVLRLQSEYQFSEIITVNGRYIVDGAVVQACKEAQIDCKLIESASATAGKYTLYKVSPHDIPTVQEMHLQLWEEAGPDKNAIAEKGLELKMLGIESPGTDFRSNFKETYESKQKPPLSKLAVYFPSSDREFAIFPEFVYQKSFGGSQADAFLAFCETAKFYNYHVVVRVHPVNSKLPIELQEMYAKVEDSIWSKLCSITGSEMIASLSKVNSYDLIAKANLCATYASSISIECILASKPTLILGESEISYCAPEICAFNEVELRAKFKEGIPIVRKEALYPYGFWLESAGINLELFDFVSDREVYFDSELVNDYRYWAKALLYIRKKLQKWKVSLIPARTNLK